MPLRPPYRPIPSTAHRALLGIALLASVRLVLPGLVGAATLLQNANATPAGGTTETTFTLSVDYVSEPEARRALSVSVEIVGLGGPPLPMSLVAGEDTNGTWRTSTMLPAGTWELVFRADASGSDPDPAVGIVVEVDEAPTPTPSPSPVEATPSPSASASPAVSTPPSAHPTARPPSTSGPTPRPPGPTPTVAPGTTGQPTASSTASPAATEEGGSTASATATAGASSRPASSEPSSAVPEGSAPPSAEPSGGESRGGGWGRTGWVVLGGMTSVAGAVLLGRQWLARRNAIGR